MSTPIDNGGPAFPSEVRFPGAFGSPESMKVSGMTLRDWFAGQALAGYMQWDNTGLVVDAVRARIASDCYKLADTMIAARKATS